MTEPVRYLTKSLLGSRFVNTFDAKNRLSKVAIAAANTAQATAATSANTVTYRINALGQRVQKIGAGTFAQPTTIPFAVTLSNPPTQAQLQALNTQVTAFYANTRFIYDEQGRLLGENEHRDSGGKFRRRLTLRSKVNVAAEANTPKTASSSKKPCGSTTCPSRC